MYIDHQLQLEMLEERRTIAITQFLKLDNSGVISVAKDDVKKSVRKLEKLINETIERTL